MRRIVDALEVMQFARPMSGHTVSTSNVSVNAGGWGLVIAALMFGVNLGLAAFVINHDRRLDDLYSHLTAIYMLAPQLQPKPEEDKKP